MNCLTIEFPLLRARGFLNSKGKEIPLTTKDILLYSYLKERVESLSQNNIEGYYESQEDIASSLGLSLSSIRRSLKKFVDNDIILCYKQQRHNWLEFRYSVVRPLTLV